MPHAEYTLSRDLAAILARPAEAARSLSQWYRSGNPGEALAALRAAGLRALLASGDETLVPQEREEVGRMLADLEALR